MLEKENENFSFSDIQISYDLHKHYNAFLSQEVRIWLNASLCVAMDHRMNFQTDFDVPPSSNFHYKRSFTTYHTAHPDQSSFQTFHSLLC